MNLEDRRAYDAVQALHVGTRSDYTTRQAIFDWIGENKLKLSSPHETGAHEIYLSDPKKTETSKLKTIVRVPVEL